MPGKSTLVLFVYLWELGIKGSARDSVPGECEIHNNTGGIYIRVPAKKGTYIRGEFRKEGD
jgi:hypothetical protein